MSFIRIKQAWRVLTGKVYVPSPSKIIYINSSKPDNTFVQLLSWHDYLLALDESGKIWKLDEDRALGGFVVQLIQESPRSY